jgi:hypothetical protein
MWHICSTTLINVPTHEREQRQAADIKSVEIYRAGISRLVNYAQQRVDLFPITKPHTAHLLTENERETVRSLWSRLLDYYILLDSIGSFHADYYKLANSDDRTAIIISLCITGRVIQNGSVLLALKTSTTDAPFNFMRPHYKKSA